MPSENLDAIVDEPEVIEADAEVTESEVEESADKGVEAKDSSTEPVKDKTQDRIDELTKKWRDSEREVGRLMAQASEKPLPEPTIDLGAKTIEDFDYDVAAHQKYVTEKAKSEALRIVSETQQHETQNARNSQFAARESEFAEKNDDYFNVTRNPAIVLTGEMVEVAQQSENGPALLLHLGKHQTLAMRLAGVSKLALAREMGILEATLGQPAKDSKVSEAPDPVPKIKAVENTVKKGINEQTTDREFAKWRHKTIANR